MVEGDQVKLWLLGFKIFFHHGEEVNDHSARSHVSLRRFTLRNSKNWKWKMVTLNLFEETHFQLTALPKTTYLVPFFDSEASYLKNRVATPARGLVQGWFGALFSTFSRVHLVHYLLPFLKIL